VFIVKNVLGCCEQFINHNNLLKKKEKKRKEITEKQKSLSIRIYILGGSSFSGKRSCAHKSYKKWSAKKRLDESYLDSLCAAIYVRFVKITVTHTHTRIC